MAYVHYRNKRVSTRAGRGSARRSLNERRYEIRISADCLGHDAIAFIAMSAIK
jgi:hypothetical protein